MASVVILIYQTGGPQSVFIALWMAIAIFAGVFGTLLIIILTLAILSLIGYTMFTGAMTPELISVMALAGTIPLSTGYLMWHGKTSNEKTKERAYYDMANELDQESSKAEVVINAISDGVIAINNNGQIELINPAAQRIVGWGNQDALNLDYKSVLKLLDKTGHELEKSTDPVFTVLTTNQPEHRNDLQIQTSSGKKIEAEVFVSALGKLGSGAIIVFRDVTKERAEGRSQTEFISTASHEMRTPVASIEGYLGLALNPATAQIDDKARDFIGKAHEAAQHLGRLFQDLLDITKADDGRLQNNPKPIDLVSFTSNIIDGLRMKADEKKLRLFYKPNNADDSGGTRSVAPVYYVNLDNDHLREVLSNLVENAVKYTPEGQVTVDIQGDQEHVTVSISDSGIGIPAEDIPHLFQKFYRVDNTDTREIGGTGLGLYLCRRLIETMGGRIWVESEYKKGSTFFVELPRISHADANRIIESVKDETISDKKAQYMTSEQDKVLEGIADITDENSANDKQHRQTALNTPIILSHGDDSRNKTGKSTPKTPEPTAVEVLSPESVKPTPQPLVVTPIKTSPSMPQDTTPPAPQEKTVDLLTNSSESQAESTEPRRAKNPMVVPGSIKDMPSNLQTTPKIAKTTPAQTLATVPEPAAAASILADLASAKPSVGAPKPVSMHGPSITPITPPSEAKALTQSSAADQLKNFIEANPARIAPSMANLGQRETPLAKQAATTRGLAIPKR